MRNGKCFIDTFDFFVESIFWKEGNMDELGINLIGPQSLTSVHDS